MISCEHFTYTSTHTSQKTGYQIVSRSIGISDKIFKEVENYLLPIGVNLSIFDESEFLLLLKNDLIAYGKICNIGIGYDGRRNTLHTHVIIIKKTDFEKINNDTQIFRSYIIKQSDNIPGYLQPLIITEKYDISPDWEILNTINDIFLEEFSRLLFTKKPMAVLEIKPNDLIPKLLRLFPPSMRNISFSTLIGQPDKQRVFHIIQTLKQNKSKIYDKYSLLDYDLKLKIDKKNSIKNINYFLKILKTRDIVLLNEFFIYFESIHMKNHVKAFNLILSYLQFKKVVESEKAKYAYDILALLDSEDDEFALQYIEKIRNHIDKEDIENYVRIFSIGKLLKTYQEETISYYLIKNIINKLEYPDNKTISLLITMMYQKRKKEFEKNASNIIIDVCNDSQLENKIMKVFLECEFLNPYLIYAIHENSLPNYKKQQLIEKTMFYSLHYNPKILISILDQDVFDYSNWNDTHNFKNIMTILFSSRIFFNEQSPQTILTIIQQVQTKIGAYLQKNPSEITADKDNLIAILIIMLNMLEYLTTIRKIEIGNEIGKYINEKEKLKKIFSKYGILQHVTYKFSSVSELVTPMVIPLVYPSLKSKWDEDKFHNSY